MPKLIIVLMMFILPVISNSNEIDQYIKIQEKMLKKKLAKKKRWENRKVIRPGPPTDPSKNIKKIKKCEDGDLLTCSLLASNFRSFGKKEEAYRYSKKGCMGKGLWAIHSCEYLLAHTQSFDERINISKQLCKLTKKSPCPDLALTYQSAAANDDEKKDAFIEKSKDSFSKLCDANNPGKTYVYCYDYLNTLLISGDLKELKKMCRIIYLKTEIKHGIFFDQICIKQI